MLAFDRPSFRFRLACIASGLLASAAVAAPALAQEDRIRPVTDAELETPSPDDWLMWRRTLDGWGYSPLDQINRENVGAATAAKAAARRPDAIHARRNRNDGRSNASMSPPLH
jgi:alcohol dehydrogenase (cytochrome c)